MTDFIGEDGRILKAEEKLEALPRKKVLTLHRVMMTPELSCRRASSALKRH